MSKVGTYRIITDGKVFVVQKLKAFLWWKSWHDLHDLVIGSIPPRWRVKEFKTAEEAEKVAQDLIEADNRRWKVVREVVTS